jgi:hypothetical protein
VTPGQLVSAVSIALDVPRETVFQHDRNLVVAGLRTFGGRGRNAPTVTHLDAARLVTAILGSVRVLDSVNTVLLCEQATGTDTDGLFPELPQTHNFVEGLAAIIAEANTPLMFENFDEYVRRFAEFHIFVYARFRCAIAFDPIFLGAQQKIIMYNQPRFHGVRKEPKERTDRDRFISSDCGIAQDRKIRGNSIMILGRAFLEDGLAFKTTEEAMLGWIPSSTGKTKKRNSKKAAR